MLAEFAVIAEEITYSSPQIPLISNLTGQQADESIATADYWIRHVRQPVRFAQSMETLHQQKYQIFLEVGAKPILLGMGRQCLPEDVGVWLPSLRPPQEDWQPILRSLGQFSVQGIEIDWEGFDRDYARHQVVLPTYPFQRQRYWIETEKADLTSPELKLLSQGKTEQLIEKLEQTGNFSVAERQLLPKLIKLLREQTVTPEKSIVSQDWFYEIEWIIQENSSQSLPSRDPKHWLILADQYGVAKELAILIRSQGDSCTLVYSGKQYQQIASDTFSFNPQDSETFQQLIKQITAQQLALTEVVQCWSLPSPNQLDISCDDLSALSQLSCGTTLSLVQVLAEARLPQAPRLWLVTQGAQVLAQQKPTILGIPQASLWGLGKVIALEHPELNCVRIDLDPKQTIEQQAQALFTELGTENREDQIALRKGQRYVPRLVHSREIKPKKESLQFQENKTYLITGGTGALGLQVAHWMVEKRSQKFSIASPQTP